MKIRNLSICLIAMHLTLTCASLGSRDAAKKLTVVFCGDVMLDWGVKEVFEKKGPSYPLAGIKGFLSKFDYRFCNLECPISDSGQPDPEKKYVFQAAARSAGILSHGGINGVSLANNHSMDFGHEGLMNTMIELSARGIQYTGAGMDAGEAHMPVLVEIRDIRLAILGYTNIGTNTSYAGAAAPGIARAAGDLMRRDIQFCKRFSDFVVVTLHWGEEYAEYPTQEQVEMAHAVIEAGADAVIGHHAHIYQGVEIYRGKPVFSSLGNFLFGSTNESIRDNILVSLVFRKDRIESIEIYAVDGNTDSSNPFQPYRVTGTDAHALLSHLVTLSKALGPDFPEKAKLEDSTLRYDFPSGEKHGKESHTNP
jgi:poly-gamma-glutamate synthesis protein (capsule biosynthesis protein)